MIKFNSLLLAMLLSLIGFSNTIFTVDYALFQDNQNNPYVEFYLSIDGSSILYAQQAESKLFQANIEATYLIEKGEEVIAFEKIQLNSPEYKEEDPKLDLIDLRRLSIPEGDYTFTVIIKDLITKNSSEASAPLKNVKKVEDQIVFSSIQLAESYTAQTSKTPFVKNGFDIAPNVTHTFNKSKNQVVAYFEIYHADKSLSPQEDYIVDLKIVNIKTGAVSNNLRVIKKMKANELTPYMNAFKIDELASGEYELIAEARNKSNEVIASTSTSFLRSNTMDIDIENLDLTGTFVDTMTNTALLTEYIKSLQPISNEKENLWSENQLKLAELEYMQRFFYNFWHTRNKLNPHQEWLDYKKKVDFVDAKFGYGNVNGYTTERGRVYLQYGAPGTVQNVPYDRDTYPYEIWQYYKLQGQTDRKIIFYSPSMEMLGYEVLHSNIRGERVNENWEFELINKTRNFSPTQENPENRSIQNEARDLFNNPR